MELQLQHHSSKAPVLQHSDAMVQLSHWYKATGETTASTRWTVVSKAMSLLFNMLSRIVIPWMEEPGRLQSMGSLRVGHD